MNGAFLRFSSLFCVTVALAACSNLQSEAKYSRPEHDQMYEHGSLVGENGGFSVLGLTEKSSDNAAGIGVNGFLWRASLDTVSFMPIASADPFGGIITTDWFSANTGERTKLNILILDRDLRADGVKVTVFRQTKANNGEWQDANVSPSTASTLEETILTRARQLRLAQTQKK